MSEMMVITAIKDIRTKEKRMVENTTMIQEYGSILSTERPQFGSEDEQKKKVESLCQANEDLTIECARLKARIRKTNHATRIPINGKQYTVEFLLDLKQRYGAIILNTFRAMNKNAAEGRLRSNRGFAGGDGDKTPQAIPMYSEEAKLKKLRKWQDVLDEFERQRETLNATTFLLPLDPDEDVII